MWYWLNESLILIVHTRVYNNMSRLLYWTSVLFLLLYQTATAVSINTQSLIYYNHIQYTDMQGLATDLNLKYIHIMELAYLEFSMKWRTRCNIKMDSLKRWLLHRMVRPVLVRIWWLRCLQQHKSKLLLQTCNSLPIMLYNFPMPGDILTTVNNPSMELPSWIKVL